MNAPAAAAALAALLLAAAGADALPNLSRTHEVGPVTVYEDDSRPERFYYRPGELALHTDRDGRPGLHFLQMRYVGTALYGNEGEVGSHSTLTLKLRMDGPSAEELDFARKYVRKIAQRSRVELRPLPISDFEADVVYTPIDAGGRASGDATELPDGFFEAEDSDDTRSSRRAFWRERVFTIPLGEHDSQLLWQTLQRGQVLMSVSYVFRTRGVVPGRAPELRVESVEQSVGLEEDEEEPGDEQEESAATALEEAAEEDDGPELFTRPARAGVLPIRIDAARWPGLFQRVDFNEKAPPGYAVLKVYCYDFRDGLRPALFSKKIEIEAEAVGGRRVPLAVKFLRSQPDLYARSVRFPVAVYVDRPFRYRVTTSYPDGRTEVGAWQERREWARILDITSTPEEIAEAGAEEVEG